MSSTSTGVRKCSGWIFDEPVVSRRSLGASIRALLSRLPTDSQFWTDLALDCRVDIYCAIDVRTENSGLELTADLMEQMGEKGLALQLDIYVVIDE